VRPQSAEGPCRYTVGASRIAASSDWMGVLRRLTVLMGRPREILGEILGELRDRFRHRHDPYPCQQAVELVVDYLEGALSPVELERFERHLAVCPECVRYVEHVRHTTAVLGDVKPVEPAGAARAALLDAFRDFHRD
jgi:hypothetical protein